MTISSVELADLIIARCADIDNLLPAAFQSYARKRHFSVVELAIESGWAKPVQYGGSSGLPDSTRNDRVTWPLFDRFARRLGFEEFHSDFKIHEPDFWLFLESYLNLAEDPFINSWVLFLHSGAFGTIDRGSIKPFIRYGRLSEKFASGDADAVAQSVLRFVDKMAMYLESTVFEADSALRALVFLGTLDEFFGYSADQNQPETPWADLLTKSLSVFRRFTGSDSFSEWMSGKISTIRHAWEEASALIGR